MNIMGKVLEGSKKYISNGHKEEIVEVLIPNCLKIEQKDGEWIALAFVVDIEQDENFFYIHHVLMSDISKDVEARLDWTWDHKGIYVQAPLLTQVLVMNKRNVNRLDILTRDSSKWKTMQDLFMAYFNPEIEGVGPEYA